MDWLSIGIIVLVVVALVVINRLTDAGSSLNCQSSGLEALKKKHLVDEAEAKKEADEHSEGSDRPER